MHAERRRHKHAVRTAFDQAAPRYAAAALVQQEICAALDAFLGRHPPAQSPERLLDGGCGTGFGLAWLARRFPDTQHLALDFAPAMLGQLGPAPARICGDLEALPLADASLDAFWSSLALQWCDPALALAELARVLRPGGRAWIATLGPQTLWELDAVWRAAGRPSPRIAFHPIEAWDAAARAAGLAVAGSERYTAVATAPDLRALLGQIKAIGAHRLDAGERHQPLGKSAWAVLQAGYEHHRRGDGLLPASYDVILLALEKPQ